MAQMFSNSNLDFRQFNLSQVFDQFDQFLFQDNLHPSVDSSEIPGFVGTYSADDLVAFWTGANNPGDAGDMGARLYLAGNGLRFDGNENVTAGTFTGMSLKVSYGGPAATFDFFGFSVGAVAFQSAAETVGNADDISILKQALSAADRITGSAFADYAWGWNGNDTLNGNGGNDTLAGNTGNDQVYGQAGNDVLRGDAGADTLHGGAGADKLYGGGDTQRDVFVFGARSESPNSAARDVVYDFRSGIDDISLAAIDANANQAGNQAFGWGGKAAGAYKVWYATAGGNATVFADVTGDKVADFSVQVNGVTTLAAGDFLL